MADPFPKTNLGPWAGPGPNGPRALGPKIAGALGPARGRDFWAQGPLGPGPNGPRALARAQIGLGEWVGQGQAIKYIIYYILYNLKPLATVGRIKGKFLTGKVTF